MPIKSPYSPPVNLPITAAQRVKIINYLLVTDVYSQTALKATSDHDLVSEYNMIASGGKGLGTGSIRERLGEIGTGAGGAITDVTSTLDFLKKLAEFVLNPVRMGELVVGVLLIGVGVNSILHNPVGQAKAQATKIAAVIPK
jgi:hypothetical protein